MPQANANAAPSFGFLSSLHSMDYGYFGGYLIVSALGRPLEFHCTSPVKPSRAQEILYGQTLQPYLLGEQISSALLHAAKLTPRLILTDQIEMLAVRHRIKTPMALVIAETLPTEGFGERRDNVDVSSTAASSMLASRLPEFDGRFNVGRYKLQAPAGFEPEQSIITEAVTGLCQNIDLLEPFDRIHEAIREAQRIGGRSAEVHDQAA